MDIYQVQVLLTCESEAKRDAIAEAIKTKVTQMQGVSGAMEIWDMLEIPRGPVKEKRNIKKEVL